MVAHDVREDYVSVERAASVYGVIVDANGNLDAAATETTRAGMRS